MNESPRKRRYHSPQRRVQAEATRQSILDAARHLFDAHGYAATTLPMIALEAGVAAATISAVFGTKLNLLNELIKSAVRGDAGSAPLAQRQWWREMLNEPDPVRQLVRHAADIRSIHERTTDLFEIVRGAATIEPEIAALRRELSEGHYRDDRQVAESLAQKQALAAGVSIERGADLLWALGSADLYRMLVVERGWSPKAYEQWLANTWINALLRQRDQGNLEERIVI